MKPITHAVMVDDTIPKINEDMVKLQVSNLLRAMPCSHDWAIVKEISGNNPTSNRHST